MILEGVGIPPEAVSHIPPDTFPLIFVFHNPLDPENSGGVPALTTLDVISMFVAMLYRYAEVTNMRERLQAQIDQAMMHVREQTS